MINDIDDKTSEAAARMSAARAGLAPETLRQNDIMDRSTDFERHLTPNEKTRYDTFRQRLREELRSIHPKMPPRVVEMVLSELGANGTAIAAASDVQEIQTDDQWQDFGREFSASTLAGDLWTRRHDETRRAQIGDQVYEALPPAKRMTLSRAGLLESYIADQIEERV